MAMAYVWINSKLVFWDRILPFPAEGDDFLFFASGYRFMNPSRVSLASPVRANITIDR